MGDIRSILAESLQTLASHPLRSFLTAMTVAFGTAVLVVLMSYGTNAPEATGEVLRQLGSTQIKVQPSRRWGRTQGKTVNIRYDDLPMIREACPSLGGLAPGFNSSRGAVVYGPDRSWPWASVMGVGYEYLSVADLYIHEGRWFTVDEELSHQNVAVLNRELAEGVFPGESALGQYVDILNKRFEVIGVLVDPNAFAYSLYVPYSASMGMGDESGRNVDFIVVRPVRPDLAEAALREIRQALGVIYNIDPSDERALRIEEQTAFIEQVSMVSNGLQWLVVTIAVVALVLGCLGAANVVGITVAERTAEIGLRKALGATPRRIRAEVFAESSLLCVGGGILGVVFAWFAGSLLGPLDLSETIRVVPEANPVELGGGLVLLVLAGMLSGIPAARLAANMDPAKALSDG